MFDILSKRDFSQTVDILKVQCFNLPVNNRRIDPKKYVQSQIVYNQFNFQVNIEHRFPDSSPCLTLRVLPGGEHVTVPKPVMPPQNSQPVEPLFNPHGSQNSPSNSSEKCQSIGDDVSFRTVTPQPDCQSFNPPPEEVSPLASPTSVASPSDQLSQIASPSPINEILPPPPAYRPFSSSGLSHRR